MLESMRPTGTGTCIPCELGKFQGAIKQTQCDSCAKGTYADVTGLSECKKCAAGKKMESAGSSGPCVNCGWPISNHEGQGGCKDCQQGTYQNEVGKIECKDCPGGRYQNRIIP